MPNPPAQPGSSTALPLAELLPGVWTLDAAASSVKFSHKTMWGLVTVKGAFTELEGEGELPESGAARGSVTVAAASVDTKHTKRDTHLRSADFLDVGTHPSIVFTATQITPTGHDTVDIVGELAVRGAQRPLSFSARALEADDTAVVLTAELTVDRTDFGLTWNQLGMMKGAAQLTLTLRFTRR
ncbi:MAG TPA: YceI family protein [Actinocrinis sp.]|nr:YceI family protein [Actinocrinis sp.]